MTNFFVYILNSLILYKIALLEESAWKRVDGGQEYADINGHKNVCNNSVIDHY